MHDSTHAISFFCDMNVAPAISYLMYYVLHNKQM